MRLLSILLVLAFAVPVAVHAAEATPAAQQDLGDLDKRIELSKQWHQIMPVSVRDQVNIAIDDAAKGQPPEEQEMFRANMRNILNYQALEKISIDAMAEVYSEKELAAMVEYYSKPEAKSSAGKYEVYAQKVYPEITRMLDQAMMKARTGGTGQ